MRLPSTYRLAQPGGVLHYHTPGPNPTNAVGGSFILSLHPACSTPVPNPITQLVKSLIPVQRRRRDCPRKPDMNNPPTALVGFWEGGVRQLFCRLRKITQDPDISMNRGVSENHDFILALSPNSITPCCRLTERRIEESKRHVVSIGA